MVDITYDAMLNRTFDYLIQQLRSRSSHPEGLDDLRDALDNAAPEPTCDA